MQKRSRSLMTWGTIGAIAGMVVGPAMNATSRKKASRKARNTFYRVSDFVTDIRDMMNR